MESTLQISGSPCRTLSPNTRLEPFSSDPPIDVFVSHSDRRRGRSSPPPARFHLPNRAASTPPETTNENSTPRPSGSARKHLASIPNFQQSWHRQQLSKKRSQYYESAFAYREPNNTARGRVVRESLIIAEVKLYYKKLEEADEQTFLGELSFQLCEIYQRPESSVMVILAPASMLLGGNAEPSYHITISALASEIAPTKNKRSTALLQAWLLECLQIPTERGVVRFEAVQEENLATNGKTSLQEIEEMERTPNEDDGALRTISWSRLGRKSSIPFSERGKPPTMTLTPTVTLTPDNAVGLKPGHDDTTNSKFTHLDGTNSSKKMRSAKSILMALFSKNNDESHDPESQSRD